MVNWVLSVEFQKSTPIEFTEKMFPEEIQLKSAHEINSPNSSPSLKKGVSADEPANDDDKAMAMMRMILPGNY